MSKLSEEELDTRVDVLRTRLKDSEEDKIEGSVFDRRTLKTLYDLASKGVIDALGGPISTGKEANLFYALKGDADVAIKVYRTSTSNFKAMQDYLAGDPRFGNVRGTKRAIVAAWVKKEFRNLSRAEEVGVRVPHPIAMKDNILVMELIGERDHPAPQLRSTSLNEEEAKSTFDRISEYISILYYKAGLVHADLSEFNVLYWGGPVIIDMGQSLTLDHPMARKFLGRDIANIARFFRKRYGLGSEVEIMERLRSYQEGGQLIARQDS